MHKFRGVLAAVYATLSLAAGHIAHAQSFPTRPIRVLVAFPPGGPTDFVGRLVSDKMTTILGEKVYVENKPGANGTIGGANISQSEPDGYSLFLTTAGAVTVSPHILPKIPYDALQAFTPVAEVVTNTTIVVVSPTLGIRNAKELVALAKRKAGALTFASTGIGSTPHLAQILFADAAGVKFLHVPYRGAAPALTDLLGGQVKIFAADVPALISQINAGNIVPIGAAANKRNAILPDVPTLAEQGYSNTDASNWYALLAPAKTPRAVIAKLNHAINAALDDPRVRQKLISSGAVPVGGTPEQLGAFMTTEYEKWGRVVRSHGIMETP